MNHTWILDHFPLFRLCLFLCCFSYWVIGYFWFKPRPNEVKAAIMAAWVQFSLGIALDVQIVRTGIWKYRAMEFVISGVPIDLHLNWALIWGFFLVWLYSRLRRFWHGPRFVFVYLSVWTLVTLAFDFVVAQHLLFLAGYQSSWWLADIAFLFSVQGVTVGVYHSILYPSGDHHWLKWCCRLRSALYVSSLGYLFYLYLPRIVLSLTGGWGVPSMLGLDDWRILLFLVIPPLLLGGWAILEFADHGHGTPVPLDPPRNLVTSGPYSYVRNPMQISGVILAGVLALRHPTLYMLIYGIDMILLSSVMFYLFESAEMERLFERDYSDYRRKVSLWIPTLQTINQPQPVRDTQLHSSEVKDQIEA